MSEIFLITFIILTLAHPISDFIIRNFTWEKWYCDPLHYLLSLNPLHYLWDKTLGQIHSKYVLNWAVTKTKKIDIIEHRFWLWLGIDQLAHQILNLIFALLLEMILS